MKKITAGNYKKDKWYPRVVQAVSEILADGDVVAPVEVFIRLNLLRRQDLEDWRFRRIPCLERVIQCNLSNASRILRLLRLHAPDRNLRPSFTGYMKWGKGRRRIHLRFSKYGDPNLETAYATHFVRAAASCSDRSGIPIAKKRSPALPNYISWVARSAPSVRSSAPRMGRAANV